MSANAIWFEQSDDRFYFDGIPVRKEKLGRVISETLLSGEEYATLAGLTLTVQYLTEMLRFTGKYGWFFDVTDNTSDHDFDNNNITPGTHWGESREFLELARQAEAEAKGKRRKAANLRRTAEEYRDHAAEVNGLYRCMRTATRNRERIARDIRLRKYRG